MRRLNCGLIMLVTLSLTSIFAGAQSTRESRNLNKEGLIFDYPSGWVLRDESNADAQQFNLARADSDAQIRVFVFRTPVKTPENAAEAKRVLVDTYVNATAKQFEQMGAKPERLPVNTEIGANRAEGVKLQATLDGEPGAVEIYWGVIGQRLVVLTFFGPDKARKQNTGAWESIRNSLKIEAPQPKATPKPKGE